MCGCGSSLLAAGFLKIIFSCLVATSVLADETLSQDPATASVSFLTSLYLHPWFSLSGTFISIFLSIPIFTLQEKITSRHAPFILSLCNFSWMKRIILTAPALAMLLLFLAGVHRRVIGTSILVSRTREVLFDFSMDCDDNGKLILKPR